MPSPYITGSGRSPFATLSSNVGNSTNTVIPINTFKSSASTHTKLKFSALHVTQATERRVRVLKSRKHRNDISLTVVKRKACPEQEVQLVCLRGEYLIGRRRSQKVAECP